MGCRVQILFYLVYHSIIVVVVSISQWDLFTSLIYFRPGFLAWPTLTSNPLSFLSLPSVGAVDNALLGFCPLDTTWTYLGRGNRNEEDSSVSLACRQAWGRFFE